MDRVLLRYNPEISQEDAVREKISNLPDSLAEREGFEPSVPVIGTTD